MIINANTGPKLTKLLNHNNERIRIPTLRIIGNVTTTSDDSHTSVFFDHFL